MVADEHAPSGGVGPTLAVGVLAVQGDFAEHVHMLQRAADELGLSLTALEVRRAGDLLGLNGLIIPGGESTAIGKLLVAAGLVQPIRDSIREGLPVWGTCAGMILLARRVTEGEPEGRIAVMDLVVQRNAFGRQIDSFETALQFDGIDHLVPAIFIRAPIIKHIGNDAQSVATLDDGRCVAARQDNLLVTAFHPELSPDTSLHAWFLREMVQRRRKPCAIGPAPKLSA